MPQKLDIDFFFFFNLEGPTMRREEDFFSWRIFFPRSPIPYFFFLNMRLDFIQHENHIFFSGLRTDILREKSPSFD